MSMSSTRALDQYQRVGVSSGVEEASPHRLIQMLMEGALARIAAAMGHMSRGETGPKGESISLAISILGGLQGCLDHERGGEIAANLDRLYDYMVQGLTEANLRDSIPQLREVQGLLAEIKQGWDAIPAEHHGGAAPAAREVRE
jgi:flagellar protein FliS